MTCGAKTKSVQTVDGRVDMVWNDMKWHEKVLPVNFVLMGIRDENSMKSMAFKFHG
jgi:hypothetical protein